ncbi:MAG: S8 family peptidase [Candidatus Jettenia sp. CY-1]|nr:MAG: S8 family peptidase [Candidatus Jettenia sp. CY-1]
MAKQKTGMDGLTQQDPMKKPFTPETLDSTVIAIPLLKMLKEEMLKEEMLKEKQKKLKEGPAHKPKVFPVIIDLNLEYPTGRDGARDWVMKTTKEIISEIGKDKDPGHQGINELKSKRSQQYLFASLEGDVIRELVKRDSRAKVKERAIYHIWPDFPVKSLINKSISTVKADAAQTSFSAYGEGIVWAVLDSGIDATHPHFTLHDNLNLKDPLIHTDFTKLGSANPEDAKQDAFGHGTHVAGIIAGEMRVKNKDGKEGEAEKIRAYTRLRNEDGEISYNELTLDAISGMSPKCKLLSLKVLDEKGDGLASNLIAAIEMIQEINGYGRRLLIHGVNMSVGYDFEPEWFACGQSPLCVEVDRLVRSGVVVVVAAGNTGYGVAQSQFRGVISAGMDLTINDPGNAELAITVGSTHKDMPHVYGVSYFSSKGPTGDGRIKPDLVAPGEKILSCAAGKRRAEMREKIGDCDYLEESGTSMAAPHVSGVIAAFLSIRREFIGQPEKVKEIFLSTATDLKRERYFQGYGLVDLMRAIQSV